MDQNLVCSDTPVGRVVPAITTAEVRVRVRVRLGRFSDHPDIELGLTVL